MKTVKQKTCKECGVKFNPFNSLQKCCSVNCAMSYSKKEVEQKRIKAVLSLEKFKNEVQDEKSLKASKMNTKMQVHAFVRNRDKYKPCISCGCEWSNDFQAGHLFKAELYETIKYNLQNINGQCSSCNLHKEGFMDVTSSFGKSYSYEITRTKNKQRTFTRI